MTRRGVPAGAGSGRRRAIRGGLSLAALAATTGLAPVVAFGADAAADWPSRPVKLVVGFAPGSTPDILARLLADRLSTTLKQPFVVENRPGAGGNIGVANVVRAPADGYTLGVSITGPLVNNVVLYPKLGYDPFKDLTPITQAATQPNVLAVASELGVSDARGLIELLKRNPGRYNYASVGAGTISHLSMELLKARTGTFVVHIPYASSPAAVTSMLAGDTQMASLAPAAVLPQARAGRLKIVAVTSEQRWPALPDVPTFRELGIPEVVATAWIGVVAPAGLPAGLPERINREVVAALKDPSVADKLRAQSMEPVASSQREFAAFMKQELDRWGPVIRRAGVTLD